MITVANRVSPPHLLRLHGSSHPGFPPLEGLVFGRMSLDSGFLGWVRRRVCVSVGGVCVCGLGIVGINVHSCVKRKRNQ